MRQNNCTVSSPGGLHTLLVDKPAGEETVQLVCRIGYCAGQQHTPRRDLLGFLKA